MGDDRPTEELDAMTLVYEGPSGLTITYIPEEAGAEVSLHGGDEQERICLSLDGWRDLTEAVGQIRPAGIEAVARARAQFVRPAPPLVTAPLACGHEGSAYQDEIGRVASFWCPACRELRDPRKEKPDA